MELKETKIEIDDSVNNEIGGVLPVEIQEKSMMQCTSNFEDHSFYNVEDQTDEDHCDVVVVDASSKNEVEVEVEDEVDILGFNDKNEIEVLECNDESDDLYSSSFSGTVSDHEDDTALNDQEADSMICTDNSLPLSVRKRKLTDHWRRFIQPIMWRCKWIELKIKEVQNQAQIYDKELEESCQAKQLELENLKSEELGVKTLPPLPCHSQKTQLKKRKKRKRVEETSDVASYTLNHNLFSYYEYRKSFADIALNDNNSRNLDKRNKITKDEAVFCDETPPLEFKEGDAFLEKILLKIEAAKLEARNLKNRVDKVVNENPTRFSSVNTVNMLGSAEVFTSADKQNPLLVIKNEDEKPFEEKPVKPASVSSHHDTPPEDNETTDILLSEIVASRRRAGKAIVPDKKEQKTEQTSVKEGPSRPARKRTQRNLEVVTNPKKPRVSREKPKSNAMASRYKLPNRRNRGKRRSCPAGLRRRS